MKQYVKLLPALSAGAMLLGCTQFALAPTGGEHVAASDSRAPGQPRIEPVENISRPASEVEGIFIMGRSAHGNGQLALAEERYAQVLKMQPSHSGALNSIAVVYAQTGRTDKAFEYFRRALEIDPQASHVHNNLGYALLLAGRLAEAGQELKLASELNPSSLQTQQNLELLARANERAAAQAGLSPKGPPADTAVSGQQMVAIKPHVYELRDGPATLPEQTQSSTTNLAASTPLQGVRIEVSNGVGIRHLARRTAERLAPMGVVTARLTNQPRYQQPKTEIQFSSGQKSAAEALATKLPVAVRTVPSGRFERNIQMRLVLGHDLAGKAMAAWFETSNDSRVAQAGYDGWRWS